jgi:hypothetical protein
LLVYAVVQAVHRWQVRIAEERENRIARIKAEIVEIKAETERLKEEILKLPVRKCDFYMELRPRKPKNVQ